MSLTEVDTGEPADALLALASPSLPAAAAASEQLAAPLRLPFRIMLLPSAQVNKLSLFPWIMFLPQKVLIHLIILHLKNPGKS